MAGMKFNADIDLEKIVKLRQEIDKLKKSLIEIASVPNSDAAVKALEKQLASALKKLEKYKDKYVQTQQARLDQEKAASEQIKKQQKEIDSLIKKYEALQKQIEKGTVKTPRSPKSYTDEQISAALNTQVQSIREAREQLKVLRFAQANVTDQQERETGARTKLNIKIQENTRYLKLNSDAYTRQKMEIGNYEENIRRALDGTGKFNLSLSKMLGVIGGTAALKGLVTDMINVRGEFQKTSIAFETMLGSKEKADALMAQMVETAAKTPFDLQGVTSGAKQLLAYGTSADKVNETLVRLGNIASGLSIPLGDLVYLYGTSMSQGRLFTQDVNQFMGRGIPLVAELAKELGKTESEIRKMVTEGKVGFPELQKVIENMTNEGGKFYNLMEMQSTTLSGQISNLGDAWDSMLNSIGEETQGIASMTISAVTSIIENYKEVGAIIASLVATYGTYKAAIVVVNMLELANIALLRKAVIEKRAAAAANIVLSNSMAIAAARGKIFATVQKNIISTFKGAGKALANPYVLFAAAVGTATYGLYKFYTRETEVEKMQKRYNETKEAAARREEQHKTKVEELIASIEDETNAEMERIGAIELLKNMYPGIIEKYIDEEGHLKNLIALKKELSGADATKKAEENKTELRSYDERIKNQKEYIERMRTNDQSAIDDEIAKLKRLEGEREVSRQKVASDYINKLIADSKSKSDEELKNTIKAYKDALSQNMGGEWFDSNQEFKIDEIKRYVSSLEDLQKARLNAVQNKEYWENRKKEAEDTLNSIASSQKKLMDAGKFEGIDAEVVKKYKDNIEKLNEAEKELKVYDSSSNRKSAADKQKKDQQKSAEELLSLRRQNQQDEINLMKDGTEKELKQIDLNYQKKLDAIKKQEKDLSERQGGKLTQEQAIEISARYTNAEKERDKEIADVTKNQLKAEADAMREYLKEYGTFQQQKLAIAEEYAEKIKKATTEGEKLSLGRERDSAIQQVDINALNQKIDWQSVFGNFSGILGSQLKETLDGLKEYVNTDKFKNSSEADKKIIYEAIDRLREVTPGGEGTLNFNKIQQQMDGLGAAINRLQTATLNQDIAFQNLKKAENDYANALKTGDKGAIDSTRQALDLAKLGANAANDAYKSAEVEVQNFGNNLRDVGADTVDGLNSVASGLQSFADSTLPGIFRGLQNTLTGLSKLNIGGAVGDAIGKLSQTLSSAGVIGQIISAVLSILDILKDGIGPLISSIIDTVLNAVNGILDNILSGDMFVQIFSSIKDGIGNILNTISFGGFNSLMDKISGSNAKEVQEAIDRLTDRNETLEKSIDRLTDVMEKSAGVKSISAYEQAYKYQQEQIANTLKIAQEQARYSNSHHSWKYYMEWTDEQLRWARKNVDNNFSGTESLWGLSPEQMKLLLSNADIYEQIKSAGKGGYGGRVMEKLEAYADQAGKLDELTEKINESIMQISFDGLRDNFLESLMDMDKDAKSFSEDFSEYMQRALLNFSMGDLFDDELKAWYNGIADLMKEQSGKLTKKQIEDARKDYDLMVQKAMDERDKLAEITGYTGSSSSSSQESTKKGFAAASQDSIEELNGRFTALQIAGEEIKNQNQLQTMSILELRKDMLPIVANTTGIKDIASETRDLLRLSYEAIMDIRDNTNVIVKPIQQMASDIAEVKRNTNGLSRR
jgi:tape measure domain-containing protein